MSAVLLAATGTARWLDDVLLDSDTWVATVGPLVEQPAVLDTVADELAGLLLDRASVDRGLDRLLGDRSGPLANAVRDLLPGAVEQLRDQLRSTIRNLLDRPEAASLWLSATERGHAALLAALRGEPGPLLVRDDELAVDLGAALRTIERELVAQGFASARLLPNNLERSVMLLRSEAIPHTQVALLRLDRLRSLLPVSALIAALAALLLAPRRLPVLAVLATATAVAIAIPRVAGATLAARLEPTASGPPASIGALDQTLVELARDLDGATRWLEVLTWPAMILTSAAVLGALVVLGVDARRQRSGPAAAHDLPAGPTERDQSL